MAKSRAPRGVFGERVTPRTPDRSSFTPPVFGAQWERKNTRAGSWQGFDNPPPDDTPTVVSVPVVNVAPVIGATPDVTPAVWSAGATDTERWEMAASGAGPWTTVDDMPARTSPYTDQTFGQVLRFVEAQGGVEAVSDATAVVLMSGIDLLLDMSDITTLFQDSAGTTPVTADGDPAGRIADQSGVGIHATQATAGNKMTYRTGVQNGLSALRNDGGDRYVVSPPASQAMTVYAVVRPSSLATRFYILGRMGGNLNRGWTAYIGTGGEVAFTSYEANTIRNLQSAAAAVSAGNTYLLTFMRSSGYRRIYRNGTQIASDALAATFDTSSAGGALAGGFTTDTPDTFGTGDYLYFLRLNRLVTPDEDTAIKAYIAAKWALTINF